MNRRGQTVPGMVEHFTGNTGYIMWEFGIGRDNCWFAWSENREHPRPDETPTPFHGLVCPDGHPGQVADVQALLGPLALAKAPLFAVEYYRDAAFQDLVKKSVTPLIDFALGTERGTGSPDVSAGIPQAHFSLRWTGNLRPPATGTYTFYAICDYQVRLWVDGHLRLAKNSPGLGEIRNPVKLQVNQLVAVKVEYVHATGALACKSPGRVPVWNAPT